MVIEELMSVVEQRKQRTERSMRVRRMVKEAYVPLHRELFNNSGDINMVKKKPTKIKDDIYILPLLTESTCEQILEELTSLWQGFRDPSCPSPPLLPHTLKAISFMSL